MRLPLFTWMALITSFIIITALPVFAVALFLVTFDRFWGTLFFATAAGGDPILWQHLFWLFGHPEVYILILPAFGILSEVIPTFSRKPLFGYAVMVYSGALIGLDRLGRLGAPHVRHRHGADCRFVLHHQHDDHRHSRRA